MIVSCGEALVDIVSEARPGGAPMNTAVAAARLGAPTAFVGRVSTDEYGELLWEHMTSAGVVLAAAQRGPEPTTRAIVEGGDKPVYRFEDEGTADAQLVDVDLEPLGPGPHVLHGGALDLVHEPVAHTLAALVEGHTGLVSLDPNVRPTITQDRNHWMGYFDRWTAVADVVRGSDEDFDWIWPDSSEAGVAERLLERGAAVMVLTSGSAGATAFLPDGSVHVAAPEIEVVDTVGAGDAFVGGMLSELWRLGAVERERLEALGPDDWRAILTLAGQVAALTCTRKGADPPTRDELAAYFPAG